jgi:hypothetical protein
VNIWILSSAPLDKLLLYKKQDKPNSVFYFYIKKNLKSVNALLLELQNHVKVLRRNNEDLEKRTEWKSVINMKLYSEDWHGAERKIGYEVKLG